MVTEVLDAPELKEPLRVFMVRMPESLHAELKEKTTFAPGDTSANSFCVNIIRIGLRAMQDCESPAESLPSNFQDALLEDVKEEDLVKDQDG